MNNEPGKHRRSGTNAYDSSTSSSESRVVPAHKGTEPSEQTGANDTDKLDIVDEASESSFPASDPPNWATGQQWHPPSE